MKKARHPERENTGRNRMEKQRRLENLMRSPTSPHPYSNARCRRVRLPVGTM